MKNKNLLNPWIAIWTKPRACLREMMDRDEKRPILWVVLVTGLINAAAAIYVGWDKFAHLTPIKHASIIALKLFLGTFLAYGYLSMASWLYMLVGNWLKGTAGYETLMKAISWSFYPAMITALIGFIGLLIPNPFIELIFLVLYTIVGIWAFVIFLKLIAEAHQFSVWRAFATFAIVVFAIISVVLMISVIIALIRMK